MGCEQTKYRYFKRTSNRLSLQKLWKIRSSCVSKIFLNLSDQVCGKQGKHKISEDRRSSLTMSSGQSFTSCGRDVDGGPFLRIGDVRTQSTVVGADGLWLASHQKFLDPWLENQKANLALSTAPSSRSNKPVKVPSENLRINPLDAVKVGTT